LVSGYRKLCDLSEKKFTIYATMDNFWKVISQDKLRKSWKFPSRQFLK